VELLAITTLLFSSIGLLAYQFSARKFVKELHLPTEIKDEYSEAEVSGLRGILAFPSRIAERLVEQIHIPLKNLRARLVSAGKPINASQFLALKFLMTTSIPFTTFIIFRPRPPLIILALCICFYIPDLWLNSKIKKRHAEVLRDLPHVIDLLNICVGAGLDFMIAVRRVIAGFRPCTLVNEFKILLQEIQMGVSRREALKNLANRINSLEIVSFVRILLQADRMGTPIGETLTMQAEEIRIRRFQRGEEMALKAPIKLLAPLLLFILPVVLIIVAGPILIQFTRGGFVTF
jgi:tight adherence protein C